ncbi:MAG: hypothetical protein F6K30_31205, partial [Cyanothece sp. SIO2G6]|nr:hypothetical protein [Cyanothece sp. SIO2G6]
GNRFDDLTVEWTVGNKTFSSDVIADRSVDLGNNRFSITTKPPQSVAVGIAGITIKRQQKMLTGADPSRHRIIELVSEKVARLESQEVEYGLVAQKFGDRLSVINLTDPGAMLPQAKSFDLLTARIPIGDDVLALLNNGMNSLDPLH